MTKEQRAIVVEYISSLSEDEDVRFLYQRLSDKFTGDLPAALDEMSKNAKMDNLLASCNSASELFDLLDRIRDVLSKDIKKKSPGLK